MKNNERRKLEKFEREAAFMTDNAADFPVGSPGADAAAEHAAIIAEMRTHAARQVSDIGGAARSIRDKEDALDDMMTIIRNMNRAANAFEDQMPGSNQMFRMPRNRSQQGLLAAASAFHKDSASPFEAKFIAYGLAPTFRDDLVAVIDAVDTAGSAADVRNGKRAAATVGLTDTARRGMANSRKLDAIIRIKYDGNPTKLAAWVVARHLEKAQQKTVSGAAASQQAATPQTATP